MLECRVVVVEAAFALMVKRIYDVTRYAFLFFRIKRKAQSIRDEPPEGWVRVRLGLR